MRYEGAKGFGKVYGICQHNSGYNIYNHQISTAEVQNEQRGIPEGRDKAEEYGGLEGGPCDLSLVMKCCLVTP